ncbi:MAG: hypothetical protein QXT02_02010 [Candidatus Hadarchaeum sp.]|uniref:hypothetical protein n=1 Tax=Candidatus Hadarchaeum sp. TaxID=2883567 RepID=UPI00317BF8D8
MKEEMLYFLVTLIGIIIVFVTASFVSIGASIWVSFPVWFLVGVICYLIARKQEEGKK